MKKHFYACRWFCGRNVTRASDGMPARQIVSFDDKATRDAWISESPACITQAGYREALDASAVAAELRHSARFSPTESPFWANDDEGGFMVLL